MRHLPQTRIPLASKRQRWFLVSLLAGWLGVCLFASQLSFTQNPNGSESKPKKLAAQASGDKGGGSLYTVTSDVPLNDTSTNSSGDRFYVTIPNADASRLQSGMRGRGFEDVQVSRNGRDVVLTFRLQPGTKAHVNQRANRLDVVFTTPGGVPDATIYQPPAGNDGEQVAHSGLANGNTAVTNPGIAYPPGGVDPQQRNPVAPLTARNQPDPRATQTPRATVNANTGLPVSNNANTNLNSATENTSSETNPENNQTAGNSGNQSGLPETGPASSPNPATLGWRRNRGLWAPALLGLVLLVWFLWRRRRKPETTIVNEGRAIIVAEPESEPAMALAAASTGATSSGGDSSEEVQDLFTLWASGLPVITAGNEEVAENSSEDWQAMAEEKQEVINPEAMSSAILTDETPPAQLPQSAGESLFALEVLAVTDLSPQALSGETEMSLEYPQAPKDVHVEAEVNRLLNGERYDVATLESAEPQVRELVVAALLAGCQESAPPRRARALNAFTEYGYFAESMRQLRAGATPQARAAAAQTLGALGDTDATAALISALDDSAPEVRRAGVEALARLRAPEAVAPLKKLLLQEPQQLLPSDLIQSAIDACAEDVTAAPVHETTKIPILEMPEMSIPAPPEFGALSTMSPADVVPEIPFTMQTIIPETLVSERPPAMASIADERLRAEAEKVHARVEAEMRLRREDQTRQLETQLRAEEEARRQAEAESVRLRAEAEARQQRLAEEEARVKLEAEAAYQAAAEAARKVEEEEKVRLAELQAKRQAEEAEALRLAEETRRRLAEEAAHHQAEEERRLQAEGEARRQAEEQLARLRAEIEAQRKTREETAQRRAEAEAARREAETAARQKAEEEARLQAEAEAQRQLEEARRQAEIEAREKFEAELARQREEEEARLRAEAEARRQAEAEAARLRAEAEERRLAEIETARRLAEEEARLKVEAEALRQAEEAAARQRAEAEAARIKAEAEAARQRAEEEAQRLAAEEMRRQAEAEARIRAEAEARRLLEAELAQLQAEAEAGRQAAVVEEAELQVEEAALEKAEAAAMAAYERVETLTAQANLNATAMPLVAAAPVVAPEPELPELDTETPESIMVEAPAEEVTAPAMVDAEAEAQAAAEAEAQEQARIELQRRLQEEVERRQAAEVEMARLLAEEAAANKAAAEDMARLQAQEEARLKEERAAETAAAEQWDAVRAAQENPAEQLVLEETSEVIAKDAREGWSEYDSEFVLAPLPAAEAAASAVAEDSAPEEDLMLLPEDEAEAVSSEPAPQYQIPVLAAFTPAVGDDAQIPSELLADIQSEQPEARAGATLALSRLGLEGDEAFFAICQMFDDPIQSVRDAASRALYNLSRDRAATFTRALREASPDRRRGIGASMSSSGLADEAIGNLVDESREKTYDAFSFLFLMSKAGEVQPLVKAIKDHPSKDVRLAVVRLLALSGQPEVLPAFRRLAVRGSLPTEVRSAVMEAIFQISSQNTTEPSA